LRVERFHVDLGEQELDLALAGYTIIGVPDARARDHLCTTMADVVGQGRPDAGIEATLDDGSQLTTTRTASGHFVEPIEPLPTLARTDAPSPVALRSPSASSRFAVDPARLVVDRGDYETGAADRAAPVVRLQQIHRRAERLALVVALGLPLVAHLWLTSFPFAVALLVIGLGVMPALVWRFLGARLSSIEDRSVGDAVRARQGDNHEMAEGESMPTIVNLARRAHSRRQKVRLLDHLASAG